MRELKLLTEWADSIINEFDASNVRKAAAGRKDPVASDRDIARQAQTKYAGRDKEQALELYIADKLEDMEKRDLDQNKVINAQRKENDALRKELTTLAREVHDVVDTSQEDHKEIERIRALAGQAKSDIETRRVGRDEVESLLKQVDDLKRKPNTDPQLVAELEKKIKAMSEKNVDGEKFKELTGQIEKLQNATSASKEQVDAELKNMRELADGLKAKKQEASNLKAEMEELLKTDPELLKNNPIISNLLATMGTQTGALQALFGPKNKEGSYTVPTPPGTEKISAENGVISTVWGVMGALDDKVANIPDEAELAKLKTLPSQEELAAAKDIANKVGDLPEKVKDNQEDIEREQMINAAQQAVLVRLAKNEGFDIPFNVHGDLKNYNTPQEWEKTYNIDLPDKITSVPKPTDKKYRLEVDSRIGDLQDHVNKTQLPAMVHVIRNMISDPRANDDSSTEELNREYMFPIMKKIYGYGISNLPSDDKRAKNEWRKYVQQLVFTSMAHATDGNTKFFKGAGNPSLDMIRQFDSEVVNAKSPYVNKERSGYRPTQPSLKKKVDNWLDKPLFKKVKESSLSLNEENLIESTIENILGPQLAKYLK